MPQGGPHEHTLCWDCAKACAGCPWSQYHPRTVKGWVATPTKVKPCSSDSKKGEGYDNSYIVRSCPLFVRDAEGYGLKWSNKKNTTIRRNYGKVVK